MIAPPPAPTAPATTGPALPSPRPEDLGPSHSPLPGPVPKPLAVDALNPRIEALAHEGSTSRPRSRAGTPKNKARGSRPSTPAVGGPQLGDAAPTRPLNVTDALSYLDAVKVQFQDKPDVYNHFLDIMKDFKSQLIDTPGVIERVSMLFQGNPDLIQGFNTFLPPGYHIECSQDPRENYITVTTPMGVMTQSGSSLNPLRFPRDSTGGLALMPSAPGAPPAPTSSLPAAPPAAPAPTGLPLAGTLPPPLSTSTLGPVTPGLGGPPPGPFSTGLPHALPPIGSGAASRPATPLPFHMVPHMQSTFIHGPGGLVGPYSPGAQVAASAAATFLGNLNINGRVSSGPGAAEKPNGEFNHAIQYLNKIKTRFAEDANTYKQFLEILQAYQKDQRNLEDSQVYAQVQVLFKDAPELVEEFKAFLPEVMGHPGAPPAGFAGTVPHPPGGAIVNNTQWGPGEPSSSAAPDPKSRAPAKRRKKQPEEPVLPSSKSKKPKHQHLPDGQSPVNSPHPVPASPATHHNYAPAQYAPQAQQMHYPVPVQPLQQQLANGLQYQAHYGQPRGSPDNYLFFEHAKKALNGREAYDDFLKLLNLFTTDVIDLKTLIRRAERFLGDGELMAQFKELMNWDDRTANIGYGPPGSIRTGPPEAMHAPPVNDGQGPSYRRLPESEIRLACSARDELARSVLNDGWVSHPTWASEEVGFASHKKTTFEDALHRAEEERHEYSVHLQGLARTIAVLEPLNSRIDEMSPEERALFKLRPDLGGPAKGIYLRTIKKVYGRDAGMEIHQALQECPSVAVPIVLARLRQKDEDWRRAQREWSKLWREVDHRNFYKSLDHQGITFKQNDKKQITAKHFVGEIESVKSAQVRARNEDAARRRAIAAAAAAAASGDTSAGFDVPRSPPPLVRGTVGHQLEYVFADTTVLHDVLRLAFTFLDHNAALYSTEERRAVERFLRAFVPLLCMFPARDFSAAAFGVARRSDSSDDGVQDISMDNGDSGAGGPADASMPTDDQLQSSAGGLMDNRTRKTWITEAVSSGQDGDAPPYGVHTRCRPFFANTTFYTLLRLMQLLYSRLLICKDAGARHAAEKYRDLYANPVAVELGLDEPNGPSALLTQLTASLGHREGDGKTNVLYMYLLDACDKVFDGEMDQAMFEEQMRWFFGTVAFNTYTIDKTVAALIKQVQTIISDNRCQELWELLQKLRSSDTLTVTEIVEYRREAEQHVGSDEHLYRVEWDKDHQTMRIQLLGANDPSVDEARDPVGRWREYVDTYLSRHPTEWVGSSTTRPRSACALFLRRHISSEDPAGDQTRTEGDLKVRISLGTYRLFYESGTEETVVRVRSADEQGTLEGEARARAEERVRRGRVYL